MEFAQSIVRFELPAPSHTGFAVSAAILAAITLVLVALLLNERRVYHCSRQAAGDQKAARAVSAAGRAVVWGILLVMGIVANITFWTGEGYIAIAVEPDVVICQYRVASDRRVPWTEIRDVRLMNRGREAVLEIHGSDQVLTSCRVPVDDPEAVERLREAGRLLRSRAGLVD